MAKIRRMVRWPYVILFLLTTVGIVWANWQGDFIKANMMVDGVDVTINRDLTIGRNLSVEGDINSSGDHMFTGSTFRIGEESTTTTDFYVNGDSFIEGTSTITGFLNINSQLTIDIPSSGMQDMGSVYIGTMNAADPDDYLSLSLYAPNDESGQTVYSAIRYVVKDPTAGSEDGSLELHTILNGTLAKVVSISAEAIQPGVIGLDLGSNVAPIDAIYRAGRKMLCSTFKATDSQWVTGGTSSTNSMATLPAGETADTIIIVVGGLPVTGTITDFTIVGQIESSGNTCTVDASLFKNTAAAADVVTTNLGSITQVSVTADTVLSATKTLVTPEVIEADEQFYILVTATTGADTDVALMGAVITYNEVN